MSTPKKVALDRAGRVVIPKEIRERAGLEPGKPLRIALRDGRVEIEAAPVEMRIERRGLVSVAVPVEPTAELTNDDVTRVRDELRARQR
ncbi:MAG TPA: AbrB/MazE/SpoVT family DNA-binding domain-containing protein [Thermoanaerobaculia bacterium]|nr:AbrB/MazE/SpoVT family DNA-binding domain-containing protein [Thermoanaerobaculia bacterium]